MAQLLISGLGLIFFSGSFISLLIAAIYTAIENEFAFNSVFPLISLASTTAFFSLLTIPSIIYSFSRLINKPFDLLKPRNAYKITSSLMLLWPILIILGSLITNNNVLSLILLPFIQVLVIVIPIIWFLEIGQRGLEKNSHLRSWGILNFSLIITPVIVIITELIVLLVFGVFSLSWLFFHPDFQEQIIHISQRLFYTQMNPDMLMRIINPIIQQPITILISIFIAAGIVPIIEELFKPLGLYLFANAKLTPADGFRAGLLCGAVFGMVESLGMMTSIPLDGWASIAIGRLGTGLLHTLTTGLMGWGLATAWSERKFIQLGAIYFVSFFFHATWNMFGLILGLFPFIDPELNKTNFSLLTRLNTIAPLALVVLILIMFIALFGFNKRLQNN